MLIFPLKKQWYEKIKSGEKTIEYREVKPYWTDRLYRELRFLAGRHKMTKPIFCKLRLGYTNTYMTATITDIEIVNGKDTDLQIDRRVYAIHLSDVSEVQ